MSDLHGNRGKSVVINTNQMEWQASPSEGVWRKRLELIGDTEKGMVTSIVRFDPGAGFARHDHPLGEEVLVLEGTFADEHDSYPKGTWTLLPNNTPHAPKTEAGCTLLVKLCQYAGNHRPAYRKDTTEQTGWRESAPGRLRFDLYDDEDHPEKIYLSRLAPGTRVQHHTHDGGEEVFVIEGEIHDDDGRYPAGTWLRLADGSSHAPRTDTGCLLYVRSGHLKADVAA
ncbi:cupin domain-containing protein [Minwuia sp.]|uniref:cupin domain-containing protein n=1 Tax=Minwuia sp. TaxID=2493630 RepID=UPI003A8D2A74